MSDADHTPGQKIGRKGDPRMHRAVAARLKDPSITLFKALKIGGFHYESDINPSAVDVENVALSQRKNQLSRRIRYAKKQHQNATKVRRREQLEQTKVVANAAAAAAAEATKKAIIAEAADQHYLEHTGIVAQYLQKLHNTAEEDGGDDSEEGESNNAAGFLQDGDDDDDDAHLNGATGGGHTNGKRKSAAAAASKRGFTSTGLTDDDADPERSEQVDMAEDNATTKRARVAKNHPNFAPLIVPPASRGNLSKLASSIVSTAAGEGSNSRKASRHPASGAPGAAAAVGQSATHTNGLAGASMSSAINANAPGAASPYWNSPGAAASTAAGAAGQSVADLHSRSLAGMVGAPGLAHCSTVAPPFAPPGYPAQPYFPPMTNTLFPPPESNAAARPSAVAISSLSGTAHKAGMTLEQLAMALGSVTSLSNVLAACETDKDAALKIKTRIAHHQYKIEAQALYSKCMRMAGIDETLCQEQSSFHLQFALDAWQEEGRRLKGKMPKLRDGLAEMAGQDEGANVTNPEGSARASTRRQSNKSSAASQRTPNGGSDGTDSDGGHGGKNSSNQGGSNSQSSAHKHGHSNSYPQEPSAGADTTNAHGHTHSHAYEPCGAECSGVSGRHVHRLNGKCGHKPIIHQPKDGEAHIDFVVGDKVECYHGIGHVVGASKSMWPSKYRCDELDGPCSHKRVPGSEGAGPSPEIMGEINAEPKIIPMAQVNLDDGEWNVDVSGTIDESIAALLGFSEPGEFSDA